MGVNNVITLCLFTSRNLIVWIQLVLCAWTGTANSALEHQVVG